MTLTWQVAGVPLMCETEGCGSQASSVWSDTLNKPRYACDVHNPMWKTAAALPVNFTSQSLCHACGQPVRLGPQQVVFPGTAG